ncbi:MAG: thiol:disulfide interchange protein DsbA/DsbL [Betaproteobacteria bacterium]|jgi:thiol:disulfide interchange protein DsbA|nr:thiol:disulfide interchange protein DsbA/DsbL [Betaproteobacteria bacterium]
MSMTRRHLLIAAALAPCLAHAQGGRQPKELKDYTLVKPPQPTEGGDKIEVLEFFQYTCPHCASYEPVLEGWRKTLPSDVVYRRNPIAWNESTAPHVKIYYTLEALNKTDAMHNKVFRVIQVERRPMLKADEIADFMAANGIDRKQWLDTFNSFTVATRANRAGQVWKAYKVDGTPAMAVDGKFMTAPSMVGSREGSLQALDFLIQRARSERQGKK